MKNIKMKNIGEQIKEKLSEELGTKVVVNYINPDVKVEEGGQGFEICIYENDFDYKMMFLKYSLDMSIRNYINSVKYILDSKRFFIRKASVEEIFIIGLLKKYKCESLYLDDGYLYSTKTDISVSTRDIEKLEYDVLKNTLIAIERLEGEIIVDFSNGTIFLEEDNDKFDINKNMKDLEDYIEKINGSKKNDFEYKIIGDMILEINYKLKTVLNLCNIENINKISFKNNELIIEANINEEEMETMFLTKCGCIF